MSAFTRPKAYTEAVKSRYEKFGVAKKKSMNTSFRDAVLVPLGKERFGDDEKYTNEFMFASCPDITDEEKEAYYLDWAKRWKAGEFDPEGKAKKPVVQKRGSQLDDIIPEPCGASDILEAKAAREVDGVEPEPEPEITHVPITAPAKTKPKPKEKKQVSKPKTKKELLLELLEEEESGGLTEADVERIAKRVCIKILTDLTTEVNEESMTVLRNYEEDTKDDN